MSKKLVFIPLVVFLILTPIILLAKQGNDNKGREVFIGIIQSMPSSGLQGEWIIGGQTFSTVPSTEFDQTDGPLSVNGCANVEFRNGEVHEIDCETLSDCK